MNQLCKHNIAVAPSLKAKRQKPKKRPKNSLHSIADIFFQCQTFAPYGYLVAPTLKMMIEVAGRERSTRRTCFYRLSCMLLVWHKLIWEKAITKKRMAILMKETKIKTSSLSLTLEPGNKILIRSIIFSLSEKTRTQKKKVGGI